MKNKTVSSEYIKSVLAGRGIDFKEDFHVLPSSQVEELIEWYKVAKYRAPSPKARNGSVARYFFYHLAKK